MASIGPKVDSERTGLSPGPSISLDHADFVEVETPGVPYRVQQAFRELRDVYPQVCARIVAEDPDFGLGLPGEPPPAPE